MAFLVGGGVRDLLLGLRPKDFDVATDAHPDEIRSVFRNSRLIGRRFRLAHIRFGRDIIEVATFRADSGADEDEDDRFQDGSGRLLRDNVYGTIDEDIWRRDFTVNALYYNIEDFTIRDYTGGMADLESRTLRLIGDPETRYREDPVRMLRAIRFAAKLDFSIAADTVGPIGELGHLLSDVPAARLFDEVLKLFHTGHAQRSLDLLIRYDLLRYLFPAAAGLLDGPQADEVGRFIRQGLANTDQRVAEDKPITPMFLYAVFLWPAVRRLATELMEKEGQTEYAAMQEAVTKVTMEQVGRTSLPKRFGTPMKEMLVMQRRFHQQRGARARKLLEHKRFRAAYDFLELRASVGEVDASLAQWWADRQAPQSSEPGAPRERPRRRRSRRGGRRRSRAGTADSGSK